MRSLGWVLIQNAWCPCTKVNLDTDMPHKENVMWRWRWKSGFCQPRANRIARKQQEAKVGAWNRFFHTALGRNADTLILNFYSPETWEINFCYSTYSVCGTLWWQSKQTNMLSLKKKKWIWIYQDKGRKKRAGVQSWGRSLCKEGRYQQMRFNSQAQVVPVCRI